MNDRRIMRITRTCLQHCLRTRSVDLLARFLPGIAIGLVLGVTGCNSPEDKKPGTVRTHVFISGVVQGVAFRASTQEEAQNIGEIVGWVRNLKDGRVEGVFQGPQRKVEKLIQWCHTGPSSAKVSNVETRFESPANDLNGFEVRPDN